MRPILFIDRDGVILEEPKDDFQIDSIDKTKFVKGAITNLKKIAEDFGYYKVMVTNQDGLGTASYPLEDFEPYQSLMLRTLAAEGFEFDEIFIDKTFAKDNQPTRKPGIGMLTALLTNEAFDSKELPSLKLQVLAGVRAYPARVKCASLAWHTLMAALKQQNNIAKTE